MSADYRAQSHVHRRRSAKRDPEGVPYPSNSADNAASYAPPGYAETAYQPVSPIQDNTSVLTRPTVPLNGMDLETRQHMAFGVPLTGMSKEARERAMYGVYNRK